MTIAILRLRMRLPSRTLKEKRTIVLSVLERVRGRYNATAAEIEDLDTPAIATIAVACLSNEASHADAQVQAIAAAIQGWRLDAEILEVGTEIIPV